MPHKKWYEYVAEDIEKTRRSQEFLAGLDTTIDAEENQGAKDETLLENLRQVSNRPANILNPITGFPMGTEVRQVEEPGPSLGDRIKDIFGKGRDIFDKLQGGAEQLGEELKGTSALATSTLFGGGQPEEYQQAAMEQSKLVPPIRQGIEEIFKRGQQAFEGYQSIAEPLAQTALTAVSVPGALLGDPEARQRVQEFGENLRQEIQGYQGQPGGISQAEAATRLREQFHENPQGTQIAAQALLEYPLPVVGWNKLLPGASKAARVARSEEIIDAIKDSVPHEGVTVRAPFEVAEAAPAIPEQVIRRPAVQETVEVPIRRVPASAAIPEQPIARAAAQRWRWRLWEYDEGGYVRNPPSAISRDLAVLAEIERNEGRGVRQGVEAFWDRGIDTFESHRNPSAASIRLQGLAPEQVEALGRTQGRLGFGFDPYPNLGEGAAPDFVVTLPLSPSSTEQDIAQAFKNIAQEIPARAQDPPFGLISSQKASPAIPEQPIARPMRSPKSIMAEVPVRRVPVAEQSLQTDIPPVSGGAPLTLRELDREARGMRALTPAQRAAAMESAKPVPGDVLYKVGDYQQTANELLGSQGQVAEYLSRVPGMKWAAKNIPGFPSSSAVLRDEPITMAGVKHDIVVEIETGRARLAALEWFRRADAAFDFDRKGLARGVEVKPGYESRPGIRTINHMTEHPEAYSFTPAQDEAMRLGRDMQTQILRDAQRVGVDVEELSKAYWIRIVTGGPGASRNEIPSYVRSRLGARQGYTLPRAFDDVELGLEKGYTYETSPLKLLTARLEAGVKSIADKNYLNEIAPYGQKPSERVPAIFREHMNLARNNRDTAKAAYNVDPTEANNRILNLAENEYINARSDLFRAAERARRPGLGEMYLPQNRIAPRDLARQAEELTQFGRGGSSDVVSQVSLLVRALKTTADISASLVQGGVLLFRNPAAWARAVTQGVIALVDEPLAFVERNFDVMDRGIRRGAINAPTEFMYAPRGLASLPTRLPIVGSILSRSNRSFEWFITVGQTELYKAGEKSGMGIEDLVGLGAAIRKEMGVSSTAILGTSRRQRTMEQVVLFAPRFFRAQIGLVADAVQGGARGTEARRALGSLLGGGMALTVGINWALNHELPNLDDPNKPGWWQIKTPRGYVSLFGPYHPFLRAITRTATGDPHALERLLSSKAGIPFQAARELGPLLGGKEGTTYTGEPIKPTPSGVASYARQLFTPIGIEQAASGIQQGRYEAAGEIAGLRTTPKSSYDLREEARLKAMQERGWGNDFNNLSPQQQREINNLPDVQRAQHALETRRRETDNVLQVYLDSRQTVVDTTRSTIEAAAKELGYGKDLRERIGVLQRDQARDLAKIDKQNPDVVSQLRELPQSEHPEAMALREYIEQVNDPALESPVTGEFNFKERDRRLAILTQKYGADTIKAVEDYIHENSPEIVKELQKDRETLRSYFELGDKILEKHQRHSPYLRRYKDYDEFSQAERAHPFVGQRPDVRAFMQELNDTREIRRNRSVQLTKLLLKWGYKTPSLLEAARGLAR